MKTPPGAKPWTTSTWQVLAQLSREEKIPKAVYDKEEARIAAKWSR